MDASRSILLPLTNAAKSLAVIAGNLSTELKDRATSHELAQSAQHLIDLAGDKANELREASEPYAGQLRDVAALAQRRLRDAYDIADANARRLAVPVKTAVERHPVAITLIVAGAGYALYRGWKRYRASSASKAAQKRPSAAGARAKLNGASKVKTPASRKPVHV